MGKADENLEDAKQKREALAAALVIAEASIQSCQILRDEEQEQNHEASKAVSRLLFPTSLKSITETIPVFRRLELMPRETKRPTI